MASTRSATGSYTFGRYRLDLERGVLTRAGAEVELRPKSWAVLCYLVEHRGRLVSTAELLDAVWGPAVVTKGTLTQSLIDIRRALGDDARAMLRTVHGRGYLFDMPVDETGVEDHSAALVGRTRPVAKAWRFALAFGAVLAALALLWAAFDHEPDSSQPASHAATMPSIAVLPFVDMSAGRDQAHLGEGIAEEILNSLAQGGGLKVIARTSSFSFRERPVDIRAIAERLGVTHVLEGSVRKSGDRVRVIVQLVDARDSTQLWSKDFDRELTDIFDIQHEIAGSVAAVLHVSRSGETQARAVQHDARAYEHFLQGRFLFRRRGEGDVDRAREYFRKAIDIEPGYAAAWAALAGTWLVQLGDGNERPLEQPGFMPALEAARRALELDPRSVEGHLRAAVLEAMRGELDSAWRHLGLAEELEPENILLLGIKAGIAQNDGDFETAIELQRRAVARDPLSALYRANLVDSLLATGRLEEGRIQARMVSELSGDPLLLVKALIAGRKYLEASELLADLREGEEADVALAITGQALGRPAQAQAAIERLEARNTIVGALRLAEVHAHLGDLQGAWRWLEESRARVPRDSGFLTRRWRVFVRTSPYLAPLRDDARWAALLEDGTAEVSRPAAAIQASSTPDARQRPGAGRRLQITETRPESPPAPIHIYVAARLAAGSDHRLVSVDGPGPLIDPPVLPAFLVCRGYRAAGQQQHDKNGRFHGKSSAHCEATAATRLS